MLQWFVSILKRAEGGGREGRRMKELARRVRWEGGGKGGEEGEGGRTGGKRNAALVLLASSLVVLYVVAGGGKGGGGGREGGGAFSFPLPTRADEARANLRKASEGAWKALKEGVGLVTESVGMVVEYAQQWRVGGGGRRGGGRGGGRM